LQAALNKQEAMNRSRIIKGIFWELRAAGVEGSAREILQLADFMLRSHLGEVGSSDDFGRIVDSRTLPLIAVDYAIADGGWRIIDFENQQSSFFDTDMVSFNETKRKIERYVGSLWAHSLPLD
jgi:hypothetical protein